MTEEFDYVLDRELSVYSGGDLSALLAFHQPQVSAITATSQDALLDWGGVYALSAYHNDGTTHLGAIAMDKLLGLDVKLSHVATGANAGLYYDGELIATYAGERFRIPGISADEVIAAA